MTTNESVYPLHDAAPVRHFHGLRVSLSAMIVMLVLALLVYAAWERVRSAEQAWDREALNLQQIYQIHISSAAQQLETAGSLIGSDPHVADALKGVPLQTLRAHLGPVLAQLSRSALVQQFYLVRPDGSLLARLREPPESAPFDLPRRLLADSPQTGIIEGERTLLLASAVPVRSGNMLIGYLATSVPFTTVLDALPVAPTGGIWVFSHHRSLPGPWPLWARIGTRSGVIADARQAILKLSEDWFPDEASGSTDLEVGGQRLRISTFPVAGPDGEHAAHVVIARESAWAKLYRGAFILLSTAAAVVAGVLLLLLRRTTLRLAKAVASSHQLLEARVTERTQALERVNSALRVEIRLREEAEVEMRRLQAERFHVARLYTLGQLASEIAHEVSQPLAAIRNYTGACLHASASDSLSKEAFLEAMQEIRAQATRAADTVVHLRNFSQRRAAKRIPTDLHALIVQACDFLRSEIEQSGAQIKFDLAVGVPPCNVDPVLIEQVMLNLVRNALEAMEQTPMDARLITVTLVQHSDAAEIAVCDGGPGLPEDLGETIFEPFTTSKAGGMGIGLSVTREIVELHRGEVSARDLDPSGAMFVVRLPAEGAPCNE